MGKKDKITVMLLASGLAVEGPLGGIARHVIELAITMREQGTVEPCVAALWDYETGFENKWLKVLWNHSIPAVIGARWDAPRPYFSCVKALKGIHNSDLPNVDIIHSHGEFSDLAAIVLRQRFQAQKLVRTVHNEIEWAKRPLLGKIFGGYIYPITFDAEWGVSQTVVKRLNARFLARQFKKESRVMYNALNFRRFAQVTDNGTSKPQRKLAILGLPPESVVIGTIGRFVPQKGFTYLIEAFSLVHTQYPETRLIMIGQGPLEESLKAQAKALGIDQAIHWLGARHDVEILLPLFDLFISSSLWEGLPTVIMESIAAGVPVVATRVSGSEELLDYGAYGILVEPAQTEALAQGILQALMDLDTWREKVLHAQKILSQKFSIEQIAQQQSQAYHHLLNKTGGA